MRRKLTWLELAAIVALGSATVLAGLYVSAADAHPPCGVPAYVPSNFTDPGYGYSVRP